MQPTEPHTVWWRRVQIAVLATAITIATSLGALVTIVSFPIDMWQAFNWYRGVDDPSDTGVDVGSIESKGRTSLESTVASAFSSQCGIRVSEFQFTSETLSEVQGFQGFFGDYVIRGTVNAQEFAFRGKTNGMGPDEDAARRSSIFKIPKDLASENIIDFECVQ